VLHVALFRIAAAFGMGPGRASRRCGFGVRLGLGFGLDAGLRLTLSLGPGGGLSPCSLRRLVLTGLSAGLLLLQSLGARRGLRLTLG
jgi:hypothetical protein